MQQNAIKFLQRTVRILIGNFIEEITINNITCIIDSFVSSMHMYNFFNHEK